MRQLDGASRSRVEQLAVMAAPAARPLVEALPGGLAGLVDAERLGIVEVARTTWCSGTT